jgi:hypothetical protein
MRMGVPLAGGSVCRPPGVTDSKMTSHGFGSNTLDEILKLARIPAHFNMTIRENR